MYCHLEFNLVTLGQQVKAGQAIGKMGATGNVNGAHVHLNLFDTDENGTRLNRNNGFLGGTNPLPFLEEATEPQNPTPNDDWKKTDFDNILIEAHKRSIASDDVSEHWIGGKLKDRIFDHIDHVEEERDKLNQENQEVKNERDEAKKAIITLNSKIDDLTAAIGKDAVNDHDLGLKNLELEKKVTELEKQLEEEKAKHDRPVDEAIDHYEPILNEFFKNLVKGKRTKSLIERIKQFVGRYFDGK